MKKPQQCQGFPPLTPTLRFAPSLYSEQYRRSASRPGQQTQ